MFPDFSNLTFPSWATTPEAKAFFAFFVFAAFVQLTRAGLRWFRNTSDDLGKDEP